MAATGYTPISLYYSTTAATAPTAGNLVNGELAINITDGKLYYKDNAGVVQVIAGKGGAGVAGGSNTQVQYNSSGSLAGSANMTFDGTYLTVNSLKDSALTSGRVTYATTSGLLTDSANMTFNGTSLTLANDASISGLTVGKGGGSVASNTAIGNTTLPSGTTGTNNVVVGYFTGAAMTTGSNNTALGQFALPANTTGSNNTVLGQASLASNTTGSSNIAVGVGALVANTTASNNTAVGYQAGYSNSTGNALVALGYQALYSNSTAIYSVAIGNAALYSNTTGNYNTGVGYNALYTNTTGTQNTAVGLNAMQFGNGSYSASYGVASLQNNSGTYNSGFGNYSLNANTSGSYNTALGMQALQANTTASNNTAVGYQAGYSNTTSSGIGLNTFLGQAAGYSNTTGWSNTFVGTQAGYSVTTGTANTFIGANNNSTGSAGFYVTTGAKNTILGCYNGNQGGLDIRTASNYIVLSDGDGNPRGFFYGVNGDFIVGSGNGATSDVGKISGAQSIAGGYCFGSYAQVNSGTYYHMQFTETGTLRGQITSNGTNTTYATSSDYRLKDNVAPMKGALTAVSQLKPVTYTWKSNGSAGEGFIAHELAEICPQAVIGEKDAVNEDGSIKPQMIDTSFLVATLTASIQELKAIVDAQAERIAILEAK